MDEKTTQRIKKLQALAERGTLGGDIYGISKAFDEHNRT